MPRTLNDLQVAERARVQSLRTQGSMRRRFSDIGLVAGTTVECLGRSPLGDPSAFLIRGAVIALRREDCKGIVIE